MHSACRRNHLNASFLGWVLLYVHLNASFLGWVLLYVHLNASFLGWVLLYVHRNRRFIRDGSPGRPPRLSHSSWTLGEGGWMVECCFTSTETVGLLGAGAQDVQLLDVDRNHRLIRDGSPGQPPRLSHSSWTLLPFSSLRAGYGREWATLLLLHDFGSSQNGVAKMFLN